MTTARARTISLCALTAAAISPAAFGVIIRNDRSQADYLGAAQDSRFEAVGQMMRGGELRGGGVLVAEDWVLTSAGNVIGTDPDESQWEFNMGGTMYSVAEIKIHPKFYRDPVQGADLALVRLTDAILDVDTIPVYAGSDELGQLAELVGPGTTGFGQGGNLVQDGQFRAGTQEIDVVFDDGKVAWLMTDFDDPADPSASVFGSDVPTDREFGLGSGDFGAPLFVDVDGQLAVAGVASFFMPNPRYGSEQYYSRVSHYIDFFRDCGVPEIVPTPGALSALGVFGLIATRRRR
ncbi:MAG: hypothetical protein AAF138_11520 [Planctomycetota bacterium]